MSSLRAERRIGSRGRSRSKYGASARVDGVTDARREGEGCAELRLATGNGAFCKSEEGTVEGPWNWRSLLTGLYRLRDEEDLSNDDRPRFCGTIEGTRASTAEGDRLAVGLNSFCGNVLFLGGRPRFRGIVVWVSSVDRRGELSSLSRSRSGRDSNGDNGKMLLEAATRSDVDPEAD